MSAWQQNCGWPLGESTQNHRTEWQVGCHTDNLKQGFSSIWVLSLLSHCCLFHKIKSGHDRQCYYVLAYSHMSVSQCCSVQVVRLWEHQHWPLFHLTWEKKKSLHKNHPSTQACICKHINKCGIFSNVLLMNDPKLFWGWPRTWEKAEIGMY